MYLDVCVCSVSSVFNITVLDDWLDEKDIAVAVLIIAGNCHCEMDDMSEESHGHGDFVLFLKELMILST